MAVVRGRWSLPNHHPRWATERKPRSIFVVCQFLSCAGPPLLMGRWCSVWIAGTNVVGPLPGAVGRRPITITIHGGATERKPVQAIRPSLVLVDCARVFNTVGIYLSYLLYFSCIVHVLYTYVCTVVVYTVVSLHVINYMCPGAGTVGCTGGAWYRCQAVLFVVCVLFMSVHLCRTK